MHPDDYAVNVAEGDEAFLPDYVHEFALAEKLRIPVRELPDQPFGLVKAAGVLLEAESIMNAKRNASTS